MCRQRNLEENQKNQKNQSFSRDGSEHVMSANEKAAPPISPNSLVFLVFLVFLEVSLATNFIISGELWFLW